MNNLKVQGTKVFIWGFIGKMATHGIGFIVFIFLARLLEPSDFILIAMVMLIIGMARVFTNVGLAGALMQRRRDHSVHYSSVFYFIVFMRFLLTVLTYFSAQWISELFNNKQLHPLSKSMTIVRKRFDKKVKN